eukprot:165658-Pleurochrysis_carterae.AAC.1
MKSARARTPTWTFPRASTGQARAHQVRARTHCTLAHAGLYVQLHAFTRTPAHTRAHTPACETDAVRRSTRECSRASSTSTRPATRMRATSAART